MEPRGAMVLSGTLSAMSKAINSGHFALAMRIGDEYVNQHGQLTSINSARFWFSYALACQLRGERYTKMAQDTRQRAEACDDYSEELAEDFDRDLLRALIRVWREPGRIAELLFREWPHHRQDPNRAIELDAERTRWYYACGLAQEAARIALEAEVAWERLGADANPQWAFNHRIYTMKALIKSGCSWLMILNYALRILADKERVNFYHKITVYLVIFGGRLGNRIDDALRLFQARHGL